MNNHTCHQGDGVRDAAAALLAALPAAFDLLAIEASVADKTPLVVVALQARPVMH